jgi:hypothetical protein
VAASGESAPAGWTGIWASSCTQISSSAASTGAGSRGGAGPRARAASHALAEAGSSPCVSSPCIARLRWAAWGAVRCRMHCRHCRPVSQLRPDVLGSGCTTAVSGCTRTANSCSLCAATDGSAVCQEHCCTSYG